MDNHSFSQSELLLLTGSTDQDVKVNTPDVPPESTRLYPKLVGFHWECYITSDYLILGRSPGPDAPPPRSGRQHRVDVDFGSQKRDVSRRHADIRFHNHKKRWELRIYGRNGVKVNNVLKRPKSGSIVLTTGSLLEIGDNRFVFILPDRSAPVTTLDSRLENLIMDAFKQGSPLLDTTAIVNYVTQHANETIKEQKDTITYDHASVLHALVLSKNFQLIDPEWCIRQEQEIQPVNRSPLPPPQRQLSRQDLCKQMSLDDIEYDYGNEQNPPQYVGSISEQPEEAQTPLEQQPQQEQSLRQIKKPLGISVQQIYSTWVASKKRPLDDNLNDKNEKPRSKRFVSYDPGNNKVYLI
ncbi:hypothetical protein BDA99DRAFT_182145 [Phascolomyces articulosus]|uniref:FHA domain-containing protein n=1 Tax=Phascolomyces articulosus TaxID=60185 RepID=A0AAD5K2A4_9FUNG|nr:hypothetical protein BDA99DRAFT_182145 [Phascolomyces articulosus]